MGHFFQMARFLILLMIGLNSMKECELMVVDDHLNLNLELDK